MCLSTIVTAQHEALNGQSNATPADRPVYCDSVSSAYRSKNFHPTSNSRPHGAFLESRYDGPSFYRDGGFFQKCQQVNNQSCTDNPSLHGNDSVPKFQVNNQSCTGNPSLREDDSVSRFHVGKNHTYGAPQMSRNGNPGSHRNDPTKNNYRGSRGGKRKVWFKNKLQQEKEFRETLMEGVFAIGEQAKRAKYSKKFK